VSKVYAKQSVALHFEGGVVPVRQGQSFDADAPIVKAHPGHFEGGEEQRRRGRPRIERATAAPGELRDL
jgi:hypothetical protein